METGGVKSKDMKNFCFSVMFILIVEMQTVSDIFYVNLWMDMRDWWEEAGVLVRSWNLKVGQVKVGQVKVKVGQVKMKVGQVKVKVGQVKGDR